MYVESVNGDGTITVIIILLGMVYIVNTLVQLQVLLTSTSNI